MAFCPLLCDRLLRLSCSTVSQLLVSPFSSVFVQFRHSSVYYDSLFSQQSCGAFDVTPSGRLHSASKRKRERKTKSECEDGRKRVRSADGNGPVVETMAHDRSLMGREVQHECPDCHQRSSTQLGRTCCQNGLLRDLREVLEVSKTSVVEMATAPLEKYKSPAPLQNDSKFRGGRTQCRQRSLSLLEMQMVLESVQMSTGWLQLAQDRGRWKQFAKVGMSFVLVQSMWVHNGDTLAASWAHVRLACWWDTLC